MKQKAFRDPFGKIKFDPSIFFQAPKGVLQAPEAERIRRLKRASGT